MPTPSSTPSSTPTSQPRINAEWLARQSPEARSEFLSQLSAEDQLYLEYLWPFWARPKQLAPPGNWRTWLCLAGRGFGKTRTGVEWVRSQIESGNCRRMALVARTAADVRDVIVEGESGILAISPPWFKPEYQPSKRRLVWPNGAIAHTYSSDKPEQLRGPQHDGALADELASWRYPEAWDMLQLGLRLGRDPRAVVATTPRPTPLIRKLMERPTTVITHGTTYENRSNLAPPFFEEIINQYHGTRLGQQELLAKLLTDNPLALWSHLMIDRSRVSKRGLPEFDKVVVAVDPSVHDGARFKDDPTQETHSMAGIVAAGVVQLRDRTRHAFILDDRTVFGSPKDWAEMAIRTARRHYADEIVAEINNGGAMVKETIENVSTEFRVETVHASRGKRTRAEPVAALYEKNQVHHAGVFAELEDEMCDWMPGLVSPNRMDALVWALHRLLQPRRAGKVRVSAYA